jgi:hypothetical protein
MNIAGELMTHGGGAASTAVRSRLREEMPTRTGGEEYTGYPSGGSAACTVRLRSNEA